MRVWRNDVPPDRLVTGITHDRERTLMHFDSAGSGPAMLLLHAFPLDGRMWTDQLAALATHYRVLVPDVPGFGRSPRPESKPVLDDWARRIVAECKGRGVERALVAGCSMGGYIAFGIHRLDPRFATAYALVDTRATVDSQDARRTRYEMVERARHEGTEFLQLTEPPVSARTKQDKPEVMARIRSMMADATPVGVMAAQRAMASRNDSRATAATIRVPCSVIYGADDPVIGRTEAQALAASIPGATLIEIPDVGHLPPLEAPDAVTDALRTLAGR